MNASIRGTVDPRFAAVRDAFAANFETGLDQGAAFAVVSDGHLIVDLWGGHVDAAGGRPWARDSLVNVWSTTKGVVALAMAMLVERGALDYEAPVARYWPEFAASGKGDMTVGCMLSHQGGLPGCDKPRSGTKRVFPHPLFACARTAAGLTRVCDLVCFACRRKPPDGWRRQQTNSGTAPVTRSTLDTKVIV